MIGEDACHPTTRTLLAYGRALIGAAAPPRYDGAPTAADRLFVLERAAGEAAHIRASGAELDGLFGKDANGLDLAGLFQGGDRSLFLAFLAAATAAPGPGVVRTLDDRSGKLEFMFAPLAPKFAGRNRYLGHIQPLDADAKGPVGQLRIGALHTSFAPLNRSEAAKPPPVLRLVVSNPQP
jgi:hypothetical protein